MDTPVQYIRKKRSLTAVAVARALGIHKAHYVRVEGGITKVYRKNGLPTKAQIMRASPELAQKIADFFGNAVSLDQILFPENYCPEVLKRFHAAQDLVRQASVAAVKEECYS